MRSFGAPSAAQGVRCRPRSAPRLSSRTPKRTMIEWRGYWNFKFEILKFEILRRILGGRSFRFHTFRVGFLLRIRPGPARLLRLLSIDERLDRIRQCENRILNRVEIHRLEGDGLGHRPHGLFELGGEK